jgi:hypothetical protein
MVIDAVSLEYEEPDTVPVEIPAWKLFPNPASGMLHLQTPVCCYETLPVIEVINVLGRVITPQIVHQSGGSFSLEIEDLPTGLYYLLFNAGNVIERTNPFFKLSNG